MNSWQNKLCSPKLWVVLRRNLKKYLDNLEMFFLEGAGEFEIHFEKKFSQGKGWLRSPFRLFVLPFLTSYLVKFLPQISDLQWYHSLWRKLIVKPLNDRFEEYLHQYRLLIWTNICEIEFSKMESSFAFKILIENLLSLLVIFKNFLKTVSEFFEDIFKIFFMFAKGRGRERALPKRLLGMRFWQLASGASVLVWKYGYNFKNIGKKVVQKVRVTLQGSRL